MAQLYPWAQQSGHKTVGMHFSPLGFGDNTELLKSKKLAGPKSWANLLKPGYKGDIQAANPASSGTADAMITSLVQLMDEDKALEDLKGLHKNVGQFTRSGTGPIKAVARGETAVSFIHYNDKKYVESTERRGLIAWLEQEVNALPRSR